MNYELMSDFEINKVVAEKLGFEVRVSSWAIAARDESVPYCEFLKGDVYYINTPRNNVDLPNYCNNPADAWPIIVENEISIVDPVSCGLDEKWIASKFYPKFNKKDIDWDDKNPLRAAMIVFLRMNEGEVL